MKSLEEVVVAEVVVEGVVVEGVVVEKVVVIFLLRVMDKVVCVLILLQQVAEDVAGGNRARSLVSCFNFMSCSEVR